MVKLLAGLALATATLAACATATLQTNLQNINASVASFNTNLNADIQVLSAQGLPALCNAAAILDAGFKDAAALSPAVAKNAAVEAASYAIVQNACAHPPVDAASLAASVVAIVPQVQAIQAAAKAGS
ncbi:MAG TPA: hypothetical protein VMU42_19500 [Candidatus Sulfotelmatobacter sp.]|nr:hypothetical protein [Candidatus Sulfotelmatobacter sp.]